MCSINGTSFKELVAINGGTIEKKAAQEYKIELNSFLGSTAIALVKTLYSMGRCPSQERRPFAFFVFKIGLSWILTRTTL